MTHKEKALQLFTDKFHCSSFESDEHIALIDSLSI